jgi:hypothetical protein
MNKLANNNKALQIAINKTSQTMIENNKNDNHYDGALRALLTKHLKYLHELQRAQLSFVDAGKIYWNEANQAKEQQQ